LSIGTYSVATCKEAKDLISQCKPHIIFTESSLRDGWWSSLLNIADAANVPLSVIVISEHPDTRLYLSVMERGAFDFLVPPFEHEPLDFVATQRRREALAQAAVA
jgi:response regulator of citrate/malate metabolism